jgi:hypothetical protein
MADEISWSEAFNYALKYIIYIIVWMIVGFLIAGAGIALMIGPMHITPGGWVPQITPNFGALVGGILLVIIGWFIAFIGSMASYFKIMSKLIRESVSKPKQELLPPPP